MERVIGIGVDQIEIGRVIKAVQKKSFLCRYYSVREQEIIEKKRTSAATNFAGKEAVVKALGTGFAGVLPVEVEILRDGRGAPYVELSGSAKEIAGSLGVEKIHISLSDSKTMAAAFAVAVGKTEKRQEE
ncbi:holo-[acyl-carrier-protein] synthase [bacterium D16-51]|nr:holo-[acyl-carrier-protein] synthase [bacterium D16-59]RKI61862.1 holo-[acyl-carrier-protein] synthase [bacterium D16-51]